jgi:hypothetical protein
METCPPDGAALQTLAHVTVEFLCVFDVESSDDLYAVHIC